MKALFCSITENGWISNRENSRNNVFNTNQLRQMQKARGNKMPSAEEKQGDKK